MIKKVEAVNFLSWDKLSFEIKQGEVTLIDGWNHDDETPEGCHERGQLILMHNGRLKKAEKVKVGDLIMGPDSTPRIVLELHQGRRIFYTITPHKGDKIRLTANHILSLRMSSTIKREGYEKGDVINISIEDYIKKSDRFKQDAMLYKSDCISFEETPTTLDPYYIGLWLGDESRGKTDITTKEPVIVRYLEKYAKSLGLSIKKWAKKGNKASTISLTSGRGVGLTRKEAWRRNPIRSYFKTTDLFCWKYIPREYKLNSQEVRMQVLAGLIDSDGYLGNGSYYEITQKSKILTEDIAFLARSLGFGVTINETYKCATNTEAKIKRLYYRINIGGSGISEIPVKLAYKKAEKSGRGKNCLHTGFKLTKELADDYFGFRVDGDHLYVLGDFTVTHNSGKSSILNAISWGIYGKIPKDVNVDDVIKHGKKGCGVVIHLADGTKILRTRKPNKLDIVNDKGSLKGKDAKETQVIIEKLIGLSFEAFCQTIYFSQNAPKKFLLSNQEDKAKILSEIQDLSVFDKARKEAHELKKLEDSKLSSLQHKRELSTQNIAYLISNIETLEDSIKVREEMYKESLEEKDNNIKQLQVELKPLKDQLKELKEPGIIGIQSETDNFIDHFTTALFELKSEIKNSENINSTHADKKSTAVELAFQYKEDESKVSEIQEHISNPESGCPTCGNSEYKHDTKDLEAKLTNLVALQEDRKSRIIELKSFLKDNPLVDSTEHTKKVEILELDLVKAKKTKSLEEKAQEEHRDYANQKERLTSKIEDYTKRIKDLKDKVIRKADTSIDKAKLDQSRGSLTKTKEGIVAIEGLIKQTETHSVRLDLLKSGFREIKTFVFNSLLENINVKANKYLLDLFEVPVTLEFANDSMKIVTNIKINGVERSLGLLSGGQQQRFCFATDLALSEIIANRSVNNLDLLILDEAFKNLSEPSMNKCLNLLESLNKTTLLIEHNSIFKSIVSNNLLVEFRDGNSSFSKEST